MTDNENKTETGVTETRKLKLFVLGETSGDPDRWPVTTERRLVLAETAEEAADMCDALYAVEVIATKPVILL